MAGWSVMPLCADGWAGGRYAATGAPVAVHRILGCQSADVGSLSFPVNVRFFFFFFRFEFVIIPDDPDVILRDTQSPDVRIISYNVVCNLLATEFSRSRPLLVTKTKNPKKLV
jgi:hypothetical protein